MDKIKNDLSAEDFSLIVAESGFDDDILAKDYYLTILLYLIKDIKGIYFKGGTALQKTILDYARISEDIDFTVDGSISNVKKEIIEIIKESKIFKEITFDKDVDGFLRIIVHYETKLSKGSIFIDLNKRAKLLTKPEVHKIKHFYPNIPEFSFPTLSLREMVAEKVAASIGRNKPRDHFDIYRLIKKGVKFDMELVKIQCKNSGHDSSILKMFNRAKKLHNKWDEDMLPLLANEVKFQEVMKTLGEYFKLKDEKEKLKKDKK